ncbi:phosphonoacetaldehyde hydrolase [Ideonella sp. DXS29W]|uniref:Phosphonoacetaldehyde hydrolase n=1 Tax=Ideonella lacteola TaxID=2984193 RepID=A0ABU9BNB5_9BURK
MFSTLHRYERRYQGPIQAVIFDWAGTLVDFGSFAPTQVLIDAFKGFGIDISMEEARQPMGLAKWDHIQALGHLPGVAARWQAAHGRPMARGDVDAIYEAFMPLQIERVAAYSAVIPGALGVLAGLRERQVRIGSCTGYPRQVMNQLLPHAAMQGLVVDHAVATDDLKAGGRPGPWMALANLIELGVREVAACVKVDDTTPGIEEGLCAGMWTVGLAVSGNELGLTLAEWHGLDAESQSQRRAAAGRKLAQAGAHEVVGTIADLPAALSRIEARLARGERP